MKIGKTVGVLGGMGPFATLFFYRTLLECTPARKDWDHVHIVIDSNPHIPSRSRHHLFGECSPVPEMIESCRKLEKYGVDFIVIPCNSACAFLPAVQKAIKTPILNIMEITVESLVNNFADVNKVAVLGSVITYDLRTYEPYLKRHGLKYVYHPPSIQRHIEEIIEALKINVPRNDILDEFNDTIEYLRDENEADAIILGCTELNELSNVKSVLPLIDSNRELALKVIELALR